MGALAAFRRVHTDLQHEKANQPPPLWAWRWGPAVGSFAPGIIDSQPNPDRLDGVVAQAGNDFGDLWQDRPISIDLSETKITLKNE